MQEKKKRKRRAYLDSFQKDSNGKYVYQGDYYTFQSQGTELRQYLTRLWVLCLIMAAALITAGCVDGPGTGRCFYVLMPYAVNVIAGGMVCWSLARFTINGIKGNPLRAYIYEETVSQIPGRAVFSAVCAGFALTGELVYTLINGAEGKIVGCILFLLLETAVFGTTFLLKKTISKMVWVKI